MTTFSYTTGNPANLTGGGTASMNDIQGPFTDLRTAINGTLDYTNFSSTVDNYYKTILRSGGLVNPATGAATLLLHTGTTIASQAIVQAVAAAASGGMAFYFDPADWAAGARTVKLRVRFQMLINATASATSHTVGLYPVATWGGTAGNFPTIATLGTVTSGSTVLLSSAVASVPVQGNSGDFTSPATGYYAMAVNSGGTAANSALAWIAELQMRTV